jgi:NAD(P)-dependent dehydrogenase (short-subunit alcohol dehydrogenase family)
MTTTASGSERPTAPFDRFDLTGKTALVTGGSRGLGREMVLAFAQAGADVMIVSRRLEACEETAREVIERTGRKALAHACHVGRWDRLDSLVDTAYEHFGRIDVLVNNAGMSPLYDKPTDVTEKLWDSVANLNLKGPFRLTALVGERMVRDGGGSIINVSTTGSIRPAPHILPYAAAKAGLNAMTEGFAHAYGPSVRVNCLMPGPFYTGVSKSWDREQTEKGLSHHALRRAGEPEEIIGAALFLASDASSFTTGAVLRADGGIP